MISAEGPVFTDPERRFLLGLTERGVRFLVIGMAAAILQGARGATEDVDLWFERLDDRRISEAARAVGGVYITGSFGMQPPQIGGETLGDRFDVVAHVHGARSFEDELAEALEIDVEGIPLAVLPLRRILESKRAAGRAKDLARMPALEEALAALDDARRPPE